MEERDRPRQFMNSYVPKTGADVIRIRQSILCLAHPEPRSAARATQAFLLKDAPIKNAVRMVATAADWEMRRSFTSATAH